jgi:hypothetical protein
MVKLLCRRASASKPACFDPSGGTWQASTESLVLQVKAAKISKASARPLPIHLALRSLDPRVAVQSRENEVNGEVGEHDSPKGDD